ncbi:YHYH domain-containing protein [Candidatus Margulisiibacteriota bacterium]
MKKHICVVLMLIGYMLNCSLLFGHPGNTNSSGCHYCRTNCSSWGLSYGQYHCHSEGDSSEGDSSGGGNGTSDNTAGINIFTLRNVIKATNIILILRSTSDQEFDKIQVSFTDNGVGIGAGLYSLGDSYFVNTKTLTDSDIINAGRKFRLNNSIYYYLGLGINAMDLSNNFNIACGVFALSPYLKIHLSYDSAVQAYSVGCKLGKRR